MPPKRKTKPSGRIKWTKTMINDLFDCRTRAVEIGKQNDASNAGRYGYIKIMKQLWDEKGYSSLGLTAQNLRDTVARYEKKQQPDDASITSATDELIQQQIVFEQENVGESHPDVVDKICNTAEIYIERSVIDQTNIPDGSNITEEINDAVNIDENEDTIYNNGANSIPNKEYNFKWDEISDFCVMINSAYDEIVHWKRNVFLLPTGRVGKLFVQELARIYQSFADASPMECIALKACSVMQALLLQKPFVKSKTKDHISYLERRLKQWLKGDIKALVKEGKCIQRHLISQTNKPFEYEKITRGFNRLMLQGKVHEAVRLISIANKGGLLSLDALIPDVDNNGNAIWKTTRDVLLEKHPEGKTSTPETLLSENEFDQTHFDPIIFERLTGESIKQAAMRTNGTADPSGVDAFGWRRFCSSFKSASSDLCNALAAVAKRLCTTSVDPDSLTAYIACRLIPLNKEPGVRPIGIGEVSRRIIAKAILKVVGDDVKLAAGTLQTCAGHESGCEAAIHAMKEIESMDETEAMLLVDATNAFNTSS